MADLDEFDVEVSRVFDAPPDRVWALWAEPHLVKQWWGPHGFTCPVAEVDLRVGGRILAAMRAPAEWGGGDTYSTWTFTEVEPPRFLAYEFRFSDAAGAPLTPTEAGIPAEGVPDVGIHRVQFEDAGPGRTRMSMTEHGYTTPEAGAMSKAGLEQCFDKMATALRPTGR